MASALVRFLTGAALSPSLQLPGLVATSSTLAVFPPTTGLLTLFILFQSTLLGPALFAGFSLPDLIAAAFPPQELQDNAASLRSRVVSAQMGPAGTNNEHTDHMPHLPHDLELSLAEAMKKAEAQYQALLMNVTIDPPGAPPAGVNSTGGGQFGPRPDSDVDDAASALRFLEQYVSQAPVTDRMRHSMPSRFDLSRFGGTWFQSYHFSLFDELNSRNATLQSLQSKPDENSGSDGSDESSTTAQQRDVEAACITAEYELREDGCFSSVDTALLYSPFDIEAAAASADFNFGDKEQLQDRTRDDNGYPLQIQAVACPTAEQTMEEGAPQVFHMHAPQTSGAGEDTSDALLNTVAQQYVIVAVGAVDEDKQDAADNKMESTVEPYPWAIVSIKPLGEDPKAHCGHSRMFLMVRNLAEFHVYAHEALETYRDLQRCSFAHFEWLREQAAVGVIRAQLNSNLDRQDAAESDGATPASSSIFVAMNATDAADINKILIELEAIDAATRREKFEHEAATSAESDFVLMPADHTQCLYPWLQ